MPNTVDRRLSHQQARVLDAILDLTSRAGYPPTVREIGASVGLASSATVHAHLDALERLGCIVRHKASPRALSVVTPPDIQVERAGAVE
jgi:repressor LexA